MGIECDLAKSIHFDGIINSFAAEKARHVAKKVKIKGPFGEDTRMAKEAHVQKQILVEAGWVGGGR